MNSKDRDLTYVLEKFASIWSVPAEVKRFPNNVGDNADHFYFPERGTIHDLVKRGWVKASVLCYHKGYWWENALTAPKNYGDGDGCSTPRTNNEVWVCITKKGINALFDAGRITFEQALELFVKRNVEISKWNEDNQDTASYGPCPFE